MSYAPSCGCGNCSPPTPRSLLASNTALARKLDELERKYQHQDDAIKAILSALRELMSPPQPKRRPIGFTADLSKKS